MIYTLSVILIAAIFSWILTLHYQVKIVDLQERLVEKETDRLADVGALKQEYEKQVKRLEDENTMLRRRLG